MPKVGTASEAASVSNGIVLLTENDNGGIYVLSKGSGGNISIGSGATSPS